MDQAVYRLNQPRREIVLAALIERCLASDWTLLAAHIRTTHVHVIIAADEKPEFIMNQLKSFASRRLNDSGLDIPNRKRWAYHGSTRWLWDRDSVAAAVRYVVDGQGEPMEVYVF